MVRTIAWAVLAVALSLGGAGIVGQLSHPPGDSRRAELTWTADQQLGSALDELSAPLTDLGGRVDGLAGDAKDALVAVSAGDGERLRDALERGAQAAAAIDATAAQLRARLVALPGIAPGDVTVYSNDVLVRRGLLSVAVDAVGGLSGEWSRVTARATDAASLTLAIRNHDSTLATAAAAGVKAQWAQAIDRCNQALGILDEIAKMRADFVQAAQGTVLDAWIAVHLRYDQALLALYQALEASGGVRNATVDAAYREQTLALAQLPADNREIIVIVAEVAAGGLNQAVVGIEDARGEIDAAIAAATPS